MSQPLFTLLVATEQWDPERVAEIRAAASAQENLSQFLDETKLRVILYETLLFHGGRKEAPQTFKPFRTSSVDNGGLVTSLKRHLSGQLSNLDLGSGAPAEAETAGFVSFFSSKTGAVFDDEFAAVTLHMAQIVAQCSPVDDERQDIREHGTDSSAQIPSGAERAAEVFTARLKRLSLLLYHFYTRYSITTESRCFAHSFDVIWRLLLQYHDPELCIHLDHRQVEVGTHVYRWLRGWFVQACRGENATVTRHLWDHLIVNQEQLLPVFVALVCVIEQRTEILHRQTAESIYAAFSDFDIAASVSGSAAAPRRSPTASVAPSFSLLPPCTSIRDVVKKAKISMRNTPTSAMKLLRRVLFPDAQDLQCDPQSLREELLTYVAIPVDSTELAAAFAPSSLPAATAAGASSSGPPTSGAGLNAGKVQPTAHHSGLNFVVLDCRSAESFNFARLPTALHVGDTIGFDAELLNKTRERFENAKGSHLCVMGTGRLIVEEQNLLKLIVLHFTQHGFPYISLANSGFKGMIPFLKSGAVEYVRGGRTPTTKAKTTKQHQHDPIPGERLSATQSGVSQRISCIPQPPAAASGEATQRSHTDAGASLPSTHSTLLLPQPAELVAKADEIRSKAATWGWGFVKVLSEKVATLRPPKDTAVGGAVGSSSGGAATESSSDVSLPPTQPSNRGDEPLRVVTSVKQAEAAAVQQQPGRDVSSRGVSGENLFTVAQDDDDEDIVLITAVPPPEPRLDTSADAGQRAPNTAEVPSPATATNIPPVHHGSESATAQSPPRTAVSRETGLKSASRSAADPDDWDSLFESSPEPRPSAVRSHSATATTATSSSQQKHPFDEIFV